MTKETLLDEVKQLSPEEIAWLVGRCAELLKVSLEAGVARDSSSESPPARKKRIPGLGRGNLIYMADDFDDPLPDSFWAGEE